MTSCLLRMAYFVVDAEVAGDNISSLADWDIHPNIVHVLRYEFDTWPDGTVLGSFPCWIVTIPAKIAIRSAGFTGAKFDSVEVSKSERLQAPCPDRVLPEFAWLKVDGKTGHDDFGIVGNRLVVSERVLKLLKGLGLKHATVDVFSE